MATSANRISYAEFARRHKAAGTIEDTWAADDAYGIVRSEYVFWFCATPGGRFEELRTADRDAGDQWLLMRGVAVTGVAPKPGETSGLYRKRMIAGNKIRWDQMTYGG